MHELIVWIQSMWAGNRNYPHRLADVPRTGSNRDLSDRFEDDINITHSERALKHIYDAVTDKWERVLINVVVQDAFAEGSMRTAHYMKDLTELGNQGKFVLKLSKDARDDSQVDSRLRITLHARLRCCEPIAESALSAVILRGRSDADDCQALRRHVQRAQPPEARRLRGRLRA